MEYMELLVSYYYTWLASRYNRGGLNPYVRQICFSVTDVCKKKILKNAFKVAGLSLYSSSLVCSYVYVPLSPVGESTHEHHYPSTNNAVPI